MPLTIKDIQRAKVFIDLAAHVQRYHDFRPQEHLTDDDLVQMAATAGNLRELQRLLAECRELSVEVCAAKLD